MAKEFDEEAQIKAVKDNEEFFKKVENQSHNFIKKYTILDYMKDQYRKGDDMSNTQKDENTSEGEEPSFLKNRREVRETEKDNGNMIKDPDGRVIARKVIEKEVFNFNKIMDAINIRPENENIDMLMMLSLEERKIINEVRQDDRLREILTNPIDTEEAERIRVEKLFDAIQGAPPREMTVSSEEERLITKQRLNKLLTNPYDEEPKSGLNKIDEFSHIRLEALKLAIEMVRNINHFEPKYDGVKELLKDVDVVHKIAERNYKYLIMDTEEKAIDSKDVKYLIERLTTYAEILGAGDISILDRGLLDYVKEILDEPGCGTYKDEGEK